MLIPALALLVGLASTPGFEPDTPLSTEIARIRRHFDGAIELLEARDVTKLNVSQRGRRAHLIAELRSYRDRGAFPRNYDFPGRAVPYFVDRRTEVLCAVAHLLALTGRRDIVDRVAAADNNVWVHELAGDAEFTEWLETQGLTIDEAARIQVPYMGPVQTIPSNPTPPDNRQALMAAGLSGVGILASTFGGKNGYAGAVGMTTGVLAVITGGAAMSSPQSRSIAMTALVAGGLSVYLSSVTFSQLRTDRLTVAPIIPVTSTEGAGLSFSFRF